MARKPSTEPRSGCPVSMALDLLGDRWSLLIVRDLMVRAYRTFGEFQSSGEGIATNILADRLRKLETGGILVSEPAQQDGRSAHYRLTEKGIALAPVMLELLIWGAHHEPTDAPCAIIDNMEQNRAAVLAEARRRWQDRDPTPLLPPFTSSQTESATAIPALLYPEADTPQSTRPAWSRRPDTNDTRTRLLGNRHKKASATNQSRKGKS